MINTYNISKYKYIIYYILLYQYITLIKLGKFSIVSILGYKQS